MDQFCTFVEKNCDGIQSLKCNVGSLSKGAGMKEATRVKGARAKFKKLSPILTAHGASYILKRKKYTLYRAVSQVW